MKIHRFFAIAVLIASSFGTSLQAAIVQYDLMGSNRPGLHFLNEPAVASGGTGGEIGAGITLDTLTNLLTISNVGWGSSASAGFSNLAGTVSASHIHGPTAAPNGGGGFTQTGGILFTLTRSSSAVTGGNFTNAPIALTAAQVLELNAGRYYINIHTAANAGGELRGFIVTAVPEPSSMALMIAGSACAVLRRRRQR
ncbi:MAG: CHRD domain-containing protein [Pirellulaceae bacterium]|nr:CHRD domain-containing protein [Pirellulaceae bacterium]